MDKLNWTAAKDAAWEAYCAKEGIELPKEEEKPEMALDQE